MSRNSDSFGDPLRSGKAEASTGRGRRKSWQTPVVITSELAETEATPAAASDGTSAHS